MVSQLRLSMKQSPKKEEQKKMAKASYVLTVGNLMYVIVCTTLDIDHGVGFLIRFMSNPWTKN